MCMVMLWSHLSVCLSVYDDDDDNDDDDNDDVK